MPPACLESPRQEMLPATQDVYWLIDQKNKVVLKPSFNQDEDP